MLESELDLSSDRHIREVMESEAQKQGLQISKSRLAELQPLAGRNPMLAWKIIKKEKLVLKQDKTEHIQYEEEVGTVKINTPKLVLKN